MPLAGKTEICTPDLRRLGHNQGAGTSLSVSFAFWLCLLAAGAVYAVVALAPKLLTFLELRQEFHRNQAQLVTLERQVHYLARVTAALETDPGFAAELARVDFDATRPGEERIPMDSALSLDGRVEDVLSPRDTLPWFTPLVQQAASNGSFRRAALAAAAVIVLLAFTFLQDQDAPALRRTAAGARGGLHWLARRYRLGPSEDD